MQGTNITNISISGFSIKNGIAPVDANNSNVGGGIYLKGSNNISITNNIISNNEATNGMGGLAEGGGIYVIDSDTIRFFENIFRNNSTVADGAGSGGGYFRGQSILVVTRVIHKFLP